MIYYYGYEKIFKRIFKSLLGSCLLSTMASLYGFSFMIAFSAALCQVRGQNGIGIGYILICFLLSFILVLATGGVYLSLNEVVIANNSYVDADDIGEDNAALLCHTDKTDCCTNEMGQERAGEWYYPSGTRVSTMGVSQDEFYRDRGTQVVRLNRQQGKIAERGLFLCKVPDADMVPVSIFVNIGMCFTTAKRANVINPVILSGYQCNHDLSLCFQPRICWDNNNPCVFNHHCIWSTTSRCDL